MNTNLISFNHSKSGHFVNSGKNVQKDDIFTALVIIDYHFNRNQLNNLCDYNNK